MNLPTSDGSIKGADNFIFLLSETSMLDMRPEIVQPSQTTAFPATLKALKENTTV